MENYMASQSPVGYCPPGENKYKLHHRRQIGLGLLVARDLSLPLYYNRPLSLFNS
jgi:hypothetical protein